MSHAALVRTADGRVRAVWRLLGWGSAVIVGSLVLELLLGRLLPDGGMGEGAQAALEVLALIVATWYVLRHFGDGDWSFVWLDRAAAGARPVLAGLCIGALSIALPVLLLVAFGWMHIVARPDGSSLRVALVAAVILVPAALLEELMVRGYLLAVLRQSIGSAGALLATSIVFGLLHWRNPGATPESLLAVTIAGLFLGAIVLSFHSLYAAWAAHFAWNFVMAALLHAPVSGLTLGAPDYATVDSGPDWVTGGLWGPEGGAAGLAGMAGGMTYLFARRRRRGEPIDR